MTCESCGNERATQPVILRGRRFDVCAFCTPMPRAFCCAVCDVPTSTPVCARCDALLTAELMPRRISRPAPAPVQLALVDAT